MFLRPLKHWVQNTIKGIELRCQASIFAAKSPLQRLKGNYHQELERFNICWRNGWKVAFDWQSLQSWEGKAFVWVGKELDREYYFSMESVCQPFFTLFTLFAERCFSSSDVAMETSSLATTNSRTELTHLRWRRWLFFVQVMISILPNVTSRWFWEIKPTTMATLRGENTRTASLPF